MSKEKGFTLMELIITVAIIAVIATIAIPNYSEFVRKSKRSDAMGALMAVAESLERYKAANYTYSTATLGTNGVFTDSVPIDGGTAYYGLALSNLSASSYTITASPKDSMSGDCTLTLNQAGTKGKSGDKCSDIDW